MIRRMLHDKGFLICDVMEFVSEDLNRDHCRILFSICSAQDHDSRRMDGISDDVTLNWSSCISLLNPRLA